MIYGLLGDLEIRRDGGPIELPGGPTLLILAGLLINANRRISKSDLIRVAWGNDEVKEAQLHKRVMALRDMLAGIGRRDDIRTHARFGYEMRVVEDDVDTLLFARHVRDADEAAAQGFAGDEIRCLRRALALWRGPHPLSNVPSEPLRQDIAALEKRHKRTAVRLFGLELDHGNAEGILDELVQVAALYPADRRLCEQLMTAQYLCGHLTDAAAAYERYLNAVDVETGSHPDTLLRAFHFAIASGDETAITLAQSALAQRTRPASRGQAAVPRQLPSPEKLIGRDNLTAETSRLLRGSSGPVVPLVVISGPGGIGKTTLALRASHDAVSHFPDGQLFTELHGSSNAPTKTSAVLAQFLRALGSSRIPATMTERLAAYRTLLADRRMLVVLDDAADGAQVAALLPGNSHCAVLVTARKRFPEIAGAHHLTALTPLGQADATELFLGVIRDSGIRFELNSAAVDQVVSICGGLPLALRIAGALCVHAHPRPTAELADRLLRLGPEALKYGELSVAQTIDAGLNRLDALDRELFLAFGQLRLVHYSAWTAAAVLGNRTDAIAALTRLAANFMIEPAAPGTRYRFHDLTREYARRRALAENAEGASPVPGRVYRALALLASRADACLRGADPRVLPRQAPHCALPDGVLAEIDAAPRAWLENERQNIKAAIEHCAELGLTEIYRDLSSRWDAAAQ